MKPLNSPIANASPAQSLARSALPVADNGEGASFARLFATLSAAEAQPSATPARAPQKASEGDGKAAQAADAKDPKAELPVNEAAPSQAPQAGSQAQAPQSKAEEDKDEDKDPATAGVDGRAAQPEAALQWLAINPQAQDPARSAQAGVDKEPALSDAPAERRGHGQRAAAKADPLAGAAVDQDTGAASDKAAAQTDFIGHIADALALRHARSAGAEDKPLPAQPLHDQAPPQLAASLMAASPAAARLMDSAHAAQAAGNQIAPRVGAAGWDRALGQKVVWMVGQGEQSASLTLNPPDLGPLQVVLTVSQSHASADFSAAQPEVRQALQDALPRLRDMLADAGISLGQANVHAGSGDSAQQPQQDGQARPSQHGSTLADRQAPAGEALRAAAPIRQGLGLVNTYV